MSSRIWLTVIDGHAKFLENYVRKWSGCHHCPLYLSARNRVILRGSFPAPVLFVGEAPGESEDIIGYPFVGPAGRMLDHIVERSLDGVPFLVTNCVLCAPPRVNGKIGEPAERYKRMCSPHIKELMDYCDFKLIVALGQHAHRSLEWTTHIHVMHPAGILRFPSRKIDIAVNEAVLAIRESLYGVNRHGVVR